MKAGWEIKKLGEVLEKTETIDPLRTPDRTFSYIDVSSVDNESLRVTETQTLLGKDAPSRARRLVRKDDVLFATIRPTLRRIAMVPADLDGQVCSTGYFVLRPKALLDARYCFYFLQTETYLSAMEALQKGASYPAVTDGDVRSQPIPIPPLAEQAHIVGILDEAFASIATAKANTQKNLENAKAVFESHLNSVFSNRGEGWVEKKLGEVFSFKNGRAFKKEEWSEKGLPIIRIQNLNNPCAGFNYFEGVPQEDVLIQNGDLLFSWSGTVGSSFGPHLWQRDIGVLNQHIFKVHHTESINRKFAFYAFKEITQEIEQSVSGAVGLVHITKEKLNNFPIPIPPLSEQAHIVEILDSLREETSRLTSLYTQKLSALEDLKKSLLHQAFTGKL